MVLFETGFFVKKMSSLFTRYEIPTCVLMLKKHKSKISWAIFYEQCKKDIRLWCYFVLFQQICRLYFICALSHYLAPETRLTTILYAMVYGLRFDFLWATCWLFIALICFTIPSIFINTSHKIFHDSNKLRKYLGGIFTVVTALIYIANIEYFREYKDIFNQLLFGWFYDDKIAILKTIYAEHHIILNCILLVLILWLYTRYSHYFLNTKKPQALQHSTAYKSSISIAIVLFYVIGFRGGIGPRPIQLKDTGITKDTFLNKAIVSPYSALKYAIKEYRAINQKDYGNANLSTSEIKLIAKKFFNKDRQYPSLAKYIEKTAEGSKLTRPKHVFLIVGESLDAWPLQKKYREFNLTPNLHEIIAQGIYFKHFLPCAYNTMATLNTIITGIPDTELHTNYQRSSYSPYFTALASQFKKMGYKPQFFYGGYLSWQHLGDFAHTQDFTEVYGAAHISNWQQTTEWGVDDRALFEFIATTIQAAKTPTFNIIMTTSNHPPFAINLEQEGFHKEKVEKLLAKYPATDTNVKELGHIWYADKTIGEFIKKIISIDNTALFAITGDHFGRRHILSNPPSFEATAVPLIIYGAKIKDYCNKYNCKTSNTIAGSHLDLGATLIELVAPKDFTYYAMGDNLLAKRKFNVGLGPDKIITKNFIASIRTFDIMYFKGTEYSAKSDAPASEHELNILKERFNQLVNIARYIIKHGNINHEQK